MTGPLILPSRPPVGATIELHHYGVLTVARTERNVIVFTNGTRLSWKKASE